MCSDSLLAKVDAEAYIGISAYVLRQQGFTNHMGPYTLCKAVQASLTALMITSCAN